MSDQSSRRRGNPPYNDLDLRRWREYDEIWTDSLWTIPSRARGDGHALEYHGNFVPQIATQSLLRYTRAGDAVLDLFIGAGTTALECRRLGRKCLGVELRPELIERLRARFHGDDVRLVEGDSTDPRLVRPLRQELAGWGRDRADLVILHPPYHDIIRFSEDERCLSNAASTEAFLDAFERSARTAYELLEPNRFAVLVIGDKYSAGELVPLGFACMERMRACGFRPRSIVVKNITNNEVGKGRAGNLWRYRALAGGFYIFKHEYVIVFDRPPARGRRPVRVPKP